VVELLVIDDPDIDIGHKPLPCDTIVHYFTAGVGEPKLLQRGPESRLLCSRECSCIDSVTFKGPYFAPDHFKHMPNGHATRDGMRVDHQVRGQA